MNENIKRGREDRFKEKRLEEKSDKITTSIKLNKGLTVNTLQGKEEIILWPSVAPSGLQSQLVMLFHPSARVICPVLRREAPGRHARPFCAGGLDGLGVGVVEQEPDAVQG